jgi:hypothetical protein
MNDTFFTVRAIGAELARRIYLPVVIAFAIIALILIALLSWAASTDLLWLLVAVPVFILLFIVAVILMAVGFIFKRLAPRINKSQRKQVSVFVDKLQSLSEIAQTPKFILLFKIARDVVSPKQSQFLSSSVQNSLALKKDFNELKVNIITK